MRKAKVGKLLAFVAGVGIAISSQAQPVDGPEVIFRNGSDPILGSFAPTDRSLEYGDEIAFDGTNRVLTSLKMEYFSSEATGQMVLRIRQQDGPQVESAGAATFQPGTIAYQSDPFDIFSNFNTVVIDQIADENGNGIVLGSRVTVTVELSNTAQDQQVGPLMRNPPIIGESADDIWIANGAGASATDWALASVPNSVANFAFEVVAVPEPSTVILSILGGVALFGARRFKRA